MFAYSFRRTRTTGPAARPSSSTTQRLIEAGVRILGYPKMLHAKAFVADGEHVLVGTCNLEAWSLRRFFEIDVGFTSRELVAQFEQQFFAPAEDVSLDLEAPRP